MQVTLKVGYISVTLSLHNDLHTLTAKLSTELTDRKIFALSKSHDTISGDWRQSVSMMISCMCEGADVDSAKNGASIRDRNPPSLQKAVLKSLPLKSSQRKKKKNWVQE